MVIVHDPRPQFRRDHGSLYDRGRADAYYGRKASPHWYSDGFFRVDNLTDEEVAEYLEGYDAMIATGERKEYD